MSPPELGGTLGPQVSCRVGPLRCFSSPACPAPRVLPGLQEAFLTFSFLPLDRPREKKELGPAC